MLAAKILEHSSKVHGRREKARHKDQHDDERGRRRRRRRRRSSSAESSASESHELDFMEARSSHGGRSVLETSRRAPGRLLQDCIGKMKEYLRGRVGEVEGGRELMSVFTPYLNSILIPSLASTPTLRNSRELSTLAATLDLLVCGRSAEAADVLTQRFRALETATQEGNWQLARHQEIISEGRVSSTRAKDREAAIELERREVKYAKLGAA